MKIQVNIEKKHLYTFFLILSIFYVIVIYAQNTNNVDTSKPYHFLQEVAKGPGENDLGKVDANDNGIIDAAELSNLATRSLDSNALGGKPASNYQTKITASCDFAIKAINEDGTVVCTDSSEIPSGGGGGNIATGKFWMHDVVVQEKVINDLGFTPNEVTLKFVVPFCGRSTNYNYPPEPDWKNQVTNVNIYNEDLGYSTGCYDTTGCNAISTFTLVEGAKCTRGYAERGLTYEQSREEIDGLCIDLSRGKCTYGTYYNDVDQTVYSEYLYPLIGLAQIVDGGFKLRLLDLGYGGRYYVVEYIARN